MYENLCVNIFHYTMKTYCNKLQAQLNNFQQLRKKNYYITKQLCPTSSKVRTNSDS